MSNALNYNLNDLDRKNLKPEDLEIFFEKKHTYYTMLIEEETDVETDIEIPCSYIVGNDEIEIYCNGIYLKCEKSADDIANYREIGQAGEVSNKVQFGFKLFIGDELTIIKKGAVENGN